VFGENVRTAEEELERIMSALFLEDETVEALEALVVCVQIRVITIKKSKTEKTKNEKT